jgi:hypothetical protein
VDVLVDRCAGLDVHKDQVTACVRRWARGRRRESETRTFLTFAASLRELRLWLEREAVTEVAMEATGVYWKPVWYELEDAGRFELKLVNPQHVKAVSGRKTDVRDAAWLAKLLECGLLAGSFVPPRAIRELRDVTRYRRRISEDRGREAQRLQKLLEDAQVKLDSVVSDLTSTFHRTSIRRFVSATGAWWAGLSANRVEAQFRDRAAARLPIRLLRKPCGCGGRRTRSRHGDWGPSRHSAETYVDARVAPVHGARSGQHLRRGGAGTPPDPAWRS